MKLPGLESIELPNGELAVVLQRAAGELEVEGQRAISASVFGVGTRMLMTADALRRCANGLTDSIPTAHTSKDPLIAETCDHLRELAGFLWWQRERLSSYCAALCTALNARYERDHEQLSSQIAPFGGGADEL